MSAHTPSPAPAGEGRRDTRQRRALREHLERSDSFVGAQQIHDDIRAAGDKVGLATIYRTLQVMVDAGEVDTIRTDDGEMLYRKCGTRHHHHLVCRVCGHAVEIAGPGVERWAEKAAGEHGFTNVDHVLELVGLCADCSKHS